MQSILHSKPCIRLPMSSVPGTTRYCFCELLNGMDHWTTSGRGNGGNSSATATELVIVVNTCASIGNWLFNFFKPSASSSFDSDDHLVGWAIAIIANRRYPHLPAKCRHYRPLRLAQVAVVVVVQPPQPGCVRCAEQLLQVRPRHRVTCIAAFASQRLLVCLCLSGWV